MGRNDQRAKARSGATKGICLLVAVLLIAPVAAGDWTTYAHDEQNTGHAADEAAPTANVTEAWRLEVTDEDSQHTFLQYSSAAVADGVVYFGDDDGEFYALDAETGEQQWVFDGPWGVQSTATISGDELYYGDTDGNMFTRDLATGAESWKVDFGTSTAADMVYSPTLVDGTLYFGNHNERLLAIDAQDGSTEWIFGLDERQVKEAPAYHNGTVFMGGDGGAGPDGVVYAVDAQTGQAEWEHTTEGSGIVTQPVVAHDRVYVGTARFDTNVIALDASDGSVAWETEIDQGPHSRGGLAVAGCTVYVTEDGGQVYALDASDGSERWSTLLANEIFTAPTVANGAIYVGDKSGQFHALRADNGVRLWSESLDGEIRTQPTVADGHVYVAGHEYMYAFTGDTSSIAVDHGDCPDPVDDDHDLVAAFTFLNTTEQEREIASVPVGTEVGFDASISRTGQGTIDTYRFDADGDGTWEADQANPVHRHTYTQPGTVTVRLQITDNHGHTAWENRTLEVTESDGDGVPSSEDPSNPGQKSDDPDGSGSDGDASQDGSGQQAPAPGAFGAIAAAAAASLVALRRS